jgi:hypothetical protein
MARRQLLQNFCLLAGSLTTALLLCEAGMRLVLNPADYLGVEMVKDPVLGATPSLHTKSGGFDQWGFRNNKVPAQADIVALGDSHTYGNTATMAASWPHTLARLTGLTVYNMGLGGYGPNQYSVLLIKALTLKPKLVVCGLYMGDDFENAYTITYGLEHWAYLRELADKQADPDIWPVEQPTSWHKAARIWLSRHSVAYQLAFHGPLMGQVQGEYQIKNATRLYPGSATMVEVAEKQILEAFLPVGIYHRLNQESPAVREGMRITFRLLNEMQTTARQHGADFLVVVIPTKESVFSEYIEHQRRLALSELLDKVIANERIAREKTFRSLDDSGIRYVDALPALRGAVGRQLYARTAADIHPGANGYRVIAEVVLSFLRSQSKSSSLPGEPAPPFLPR